MLVYLYFFGWFGGGCIGIVYLESFFWCLFLIDLFLPIREKKKKSYRNFMCNVKESAFRNSKTIIVVTVVFADVFLVLLLLLLLYVLIYF